MCISIATLLAAYNPSTPQGAQQLGSDLQLGASVAKVLGEMAAGSTRSALLRADAAGVRALGEARARRIRAAGQQAVGEVRAQAAASGVKVSGESVLDAERQAVRLSEQDAAMAVLTGKNQARGNEMSARLYRAASMQSALDELSFGVSKWQLSKYAIEQQAAMSRFDDVNQDFGSWTGQH